MKRPTESQKKKLQQLDYELVELFRESLAGQDRENRRLRGEEAAEGRGKALVLEEILEWIDGTTVPPVLH